MGKPPSKSTIGKKIVSHVIESLKKKESMATIKQKMVIKKTLENLGNNKLQPLGKVMLETGYKKSVAKNPKILTESKAWKEFMEKYFPDEDLLKVHKEGLRASKIITSNTEPDKEYPDFAVRHKYLETGYKVKGKLKEDLEEEFPKTLDADIISAIEKIYGKDRPEDD